eukprot:13625-Amphidinium_carterae.1
MHTTCTRITCSVQVYSEFTIDRVSTVRPQATASSPSRSHVPYLLTQYIAKGRNGTSSCHTRLYSKLKASALSDNTLHSYGVPVWNVSSSDTSIGKVAFVLASTLTQSADHASHAGLVDSEDHPLIKYKYLAIENTDTLLLAAQVFAHLVNRAKALGGGADTTRALLQELFAFCHAPLKDGSRNKSKQGAIAADCCRLFQSHGHHSEASRPPPDRPKDVEFAMHCDRLVAEAAQLLKAWRCCSRASKKDQCTRSTKKIYAITSEIGTHVTVSAVDGAKPEHCT